MLILTDQNILVPSKYANYAGCRKITEQMPFLRSCLPYSESGTTSGNMLDKINNMLHCLIFGSMFTVSQLTFGAYLRHSLTYTAQDLFRSLWKGAFHSLSHKKKSHVLTLDLGLNSTIISYLAGLSFLIYRMRVLSRLIDNYRPAVK